MRLQAADAEVLAVLRPVDTVVRVSPHGPRLAAPHHGPVHEKPVGEPRDEMDRPLHVGVVDVLALARFSPGHEGQENPDGPVEGDAGEVGDDVERDRRGAVLGPDEAQDTGQ